MAGRSVRDRDPVAASSLVERRLFRRYDCLRIASVWRLQHPKMWSYEITDPDWSDQYPGCFGDRKAFDFLFP